MQLTGIIESAHTGRVCLRTPEGTINLQTTLFDGPLFQAARGLCATVFTVPLPNGSVAALVRSADVTRLERLLKYGCEVNAALAAIRTPYDPPVPAAAYPRPLVGPAVGAIEPNGGDSTYDDEAQPHDIDGWRENHASYHQSEAKHAQAETDDLQHSRRVSHSTSVAEPAPQDSAAEDALQAVIALGVKQCDARKLLARVRQPGMNTTQLIGAMLQLRR